jgi:hypothetical protein
MAEQRKRAEYFQGLVNQVKVAMEEDVGENHVRGEREKK